MFKSKQKLSAGVLSFFCCILMVIFPTTSLCAARKGISLWISDVLPALLPFFICANFLQSIGAVKYMKAGIFPFVMSAMSGYPMGAKIVADLRKNNDISLNEAKRLLSFCNNSGPAFIVGAVGVGMLHSGILGGIITISHYIGALINGFVFGKIYSKKGVEYDVEHLVKGENSQAGFTEAILSSFKSLGIILAYIVLFMFVTDMMHLCGLLSLIDNEALKALVKGIMEMTVGCGAVSECINVSDNVKCALCAFIVSWGGLSVLGQTMSMLSGTGIQMKFIIASKFMHGLFSTIVAFTICTFMI